ncbi:MAG: peptidoglycan-binding protein, partial [Lachnoclostridium sp.]|nr:peptidoglycan-binding protein [Lachnoclostridium sp.]
TLYGDYPPKEPESEIKPVNESGEIVLSRVVIPEYVVVHDGPPADANAKNYYVRYTDYIKNVASSEIYATWPEAAITANVLAIQSFTLNRVFTEWYRNKNYDFTITSSTAVDHKWIPERNIFQSISDVVDNIFNNYLSRPDVLQPILTQYCDGKRVTCPGVMSQWGSKYLADDGFSAIEILKNFYGSSIYINETDIISGIPSSWPGYDLAIGSSGEKVSQLQNELNVIATAYPAIPLLAVDGIYGQRTAESVRVFQKIFNIGETGIVDFQTWYKISQIYVGVSRIAEYN